MAAVTHIDGSITGLSYAEEATPGVLPGSPVWLTLEPNSYDDFGGENKLVARRPINASRQRKRGTVVDRDANGGFEHDFIYGSSNLQPLWSGALAANFRRKGEELVTAVDIDGGNPDEYEVASSTGFLVNSLILGANFAQANNNGLKLVTAVTAGTVEVATGSLVAEASPPASASITVVGYQAAVGDLTIDTSGSLPELRSTVLDFTTLGLTAGEMIFLGGDAVGEQYATAADNGFKRIRSISTNAIVIDKSDLPMVADAGAGKTIRLFFGRVLKNEQSGSIVKKTFQLERTLGAPDDSLPNQIQSEYVLGSMVNEVELSMPQADIMKLSFSMPGLNVEQRDAATGVKAGARPVLVTEDAFNSTSHVSRIRLSKVVDGDESPSALFAYASEITLTIKNNLSPNKAVGTLGAFSRTLGLFEVDAELQAYLSDVEALLSITNNDKVSLDLVVVADNKGISVDLPLGSLGDGRPDVANDQAVMVPLTFQASEALQVNSAFNHTTMMSFFDYLPTLAS